MLRAMPEAFFEHDFIHKIREVLTRYTAMDIDLWLHSVRLLRRGELRALVPGTTFIAVIGLAPLAEKVLLEVDLRFVYRCVDRLLGGNGMAIDIHRPLTEIEQGVFSYVILKVLALFYEGVVSADQVAIRLEDMRQDLRSTADIVRHEENWVCASWKMNFDLDVGYIRALIPASVARKVMGTPPPSDSAIARRIHDRIRRRMNRLAGVVIDGAVEIGRIELTKADIRALDPGDIVLLEGSQIRMQRGPVGGATMNIGLGRRGAVRGKVYSSRGDMLVFEVTKIEIREIPPEHDPKVHHGELANPEQVIAEYEDHGEEANDGTPSRDDVDDEDFGLDDENAGDEEEYGEEEGYEGENYDDQQGGYDDQGGQAQGQDEIPIDDNDNLAESEPLLGDIPIAVIVELGRVQLTADEVIRLRAGQIIELGRSPADPVDLVVAGKLLAKGELVEIEGSLGVKLLSLVKDS
jgi:flagellar motor switch protein FliM